MKTIAASILALGLFAGVANARTAETVFSDIQQTAPKSIFDQIRDTAPKSVFDQLNETAPKTVFEQLNETAPRSDGVFGQAQRNAP